MPRKRKVAAVDEEKENEVESTHNSTIHHGPMYTIMSNVQLSETFHKKYIREMQQLYAKMDHDAFIFTFIKMIKSTMEADETNEYAYTTLLFCAKFIAAYDVEDTHPILVDVCRWLLTTISQNPHIRFRLCQFVNMILNALGVEAALDDAICDSILEYMLQRLRDINPNVRVQAILALQRLQCPDNPDDIVLRVYQFHLCSDPSPRVRQAVITSMGRNYNTIPYILDRLWDIDEKVRRHTYLHMSGYPVKAYKVSQRLQLLEQGLNDRSEMVKKVVTTIMLPQWLESYNKNYITFVSALKLDASEAEVERFLKISKVALREIFKRQNKDDLVKCLPLEEDSEFHKCVPHEKLTIEITLYWQCLIEYLQAEMADDELDMIIPELSTFCAYVQRYCESQKVATDKFVKMEFQYILLSLCEILYLYDLGDEIGRENLKKLITTILKNNDLEEKVIEVIVKCTENLITDQNSRLQFFVEIIEEITHTSSFKNDLPIHDRQLIEELLEKHPDKDLKLKICSLTVKILDLEEKEMNFVEMKEYAQAQNIIEEKNECTEEYKNLLKPLLEKHLMNSDGSGDKSVGPLYFKQTKKVTNETILKSLQLAFYMVVSKNVKTLTPNVCKLYKEFIGRHIASNQIAIRDWALRCGTAYSMLYESLAKEIYEVLYAQFLKNHNIRIWKTSITCIFELLDRYGCSSFNIEERQNKTKRNGRQLYSTLEFLDADDDDSVWSSGQAVDIIFMMSHFLDKCDDVCIISAIVNGFCRLVLHDHIKSPEIIEKLLLRYFNPSTDAEINQILGVFLENLIQRKKQEYLYPCLLPTVSQVISAPYESPLHEIKPETILRFVIDATRPQFCTPGADIHNKLALSFLHEMQNNIANKDLCKILSKELLTLELSVKEDLKFKEESKGIAEKLIKCEFDGKTLKNIVDFKDMLDGVFKPSLRHTNLDGSDDEDKSDDETVSAITTEKDFDKVSSSNVPLNRLEPVVEEEKESEQEKITENVTQPDLEKEPEPEPVPEKAISPRTQKSNKKRKGPEITINTEKDSEPPTDVASTSTISVPAPTPVRPAASSSTPGRSTRPSATPTTFGRENSTELRYLRKSLNFIRQNTTTEDGPSPKIRIEARIDSIPSPPKVQKLDDNTRSTRRNLRSVPIRTNDENTPSKQNQSAKERRKRTPYPKGKVQQSKEKDPSSDDQDSDESEVIPPSPTSSVATATSDVRTMGRRVHRKLRFNNSQISREQAAPVTKSTRSTRNNQTTNAQIIESDRLSESSSKNLSQKNPRKRALTPDPPSNSANEGDNNIRSPLRKQSKTSVHLSESAKNTTINNKTPVSLAPITTSQQENKSTSNRLRTRNSPFADKQVQRQKNTRSTQSKTTSPSSKENEPKSPIISSYSYSSSSSTTSSSSDQSDDEASSKTPKKKNSFKYSLTKSTAKRIVNGRNPVLSIHRINASDLSASRVSTRNSTRRDRQNNMIMTRKRFFLENVRSPSRVVSKGTPIKKAPATATATATATQVKASKIPVNLALRSNKSNMNANNTKSQSTNKSKMSSDDTSSDTNSKKGLESVNKLSSQSKSTSRTRSPIGRSKATLVSASRIVQSTRNNTDAMSMLRKRNI